jgi:Transposase DNA-binding
MDELEVWAVEQFGSVALGDKRRTQRAVDMAQAMARRPADGVAKQMGDWNGQRGAYRLLDNEGVSHAALSEPHWRETRAKAGESGSVVLMVQDITELDYSAHRATEGLGPIGDHRGVGLMVHNTLAIEPREQRVVGLAYQQVWTRASEAHKGKESRSERLARADRQSQRWVKAVKAIGTPPPGVRWVHVGDREIDIFPFFEECQTAQADFCIRIKQNRRVGEWSAEDPRYLLDQARQLPALGERRLELPAKPGQAARTANLRVSWQEVSLRSPSNRPGDPTTLRAWVVRTWEPSPPKGIEPIEWLLLTSVPVLTLEDALERIDWYSCRWIVEEYHSCLKTGCAMENSQLQHAERLRRLLAFLSILSVRLLQLRDLSRSTPHLLARQVVQGVLVQIIAYRTHTDPNTMTLAFFWRAVATIGGFPGRKSDGQPGWKRLWHGWLRLLDWAEGVHFGRNLPPLQDVGNP